MTVADRPEASSYLASRSGRAPTQLVARRDQVEAVGLLLGILGVLLVVVVTLGTTPGLS